jgi:hypothetical protein
MSARDAAMQAEPIHRGGNRAMSHTPNAAGSRRKLARQMAPQNQ